MDMWVKKIKYPMFFTFIRKGNGRWRGIRYEMKSGK